MNAQHKPFAAQLAQSQAASDTLQAIAALVPEGSRVLDLGCGDGALLAHLQHGLDEVGDFFLFAHGKLLSE